MSLFKKKEENLSNPFNASENKSKKSFFDKILLGATIVLIFLTLFLSLFTFYLFQFRRDISVTKDTKTQTVNDDTISKASAEQKNLQNVEKSPKLLSSLAVGSNLNYVSTPDNNSSFSTAFAYEVIQDSTLKKVSNFSTLIKNKSFAPIFFISIKNLQGATFDLNKIQDEIVSESAKYSQIYLDVSFSYLQNYQAFLNALLPKIHQKKAKLGIYIYPSWGKEVDYNDFLQVSNDFHRKAKFSDLNSLDSVVIQLYGYTSEYSLLIGPITPLDWAQNVIQFYVQEGVNRDKLFVEINNENYLWRQREIADNPKQNYAVSDQQAIILSNTAVNDKQYAIMDSSFKYFDSSKETAKLLDLQNVKYLLVSPTLDGITALKNLVADYGLGGYIIR